MSTFAFRAVDVAGVPSRGELDAETKAHVTEQLRAKGLIVLDVSEQKEAFRLEELVSGGIKMREMAVFARQFATLIAAGMPMLRSLYTLEDQTDDERLKEAIVGLRKDVEAGSSVADAMDRQPKVFDQLFRSMVRSGEGSGRLEDVLERVAFHLEKLDALRRQIRAAMLYPSFVFALALVVMLAVVAFIVPVFAGVFEEIAADTPGEDATLPLLTRITVGASNLVTGYLVHPAAGADRGYGRLLPVEEDRRRPGPVGPDLRPNPVQDRGRRPQGGARALVADLLRHGRGGRADPAVDQDHRPDLGNAMIEQAMDDVYASVRQGGTVAGPIERNDLFPAMVGHMIAVGEDTGQLEHMLGKVADFYEAEVDAKVKALTSLIEPLMIVFVGGVVGFIVISMYLPIFTLYDKIR